MNIRGFILLVCFGLMAGCEAVTAQCCSPGNPVAGASSIGTVPKHKVRTITFYRHSFSDTYYNGNTKAVDQGTQADFNYLGEIISYGLLKRLTVEGEFGYFLNKSKKDAYENTRISGWYNGVISLKYCLLNTKNDFEITAGAGLKFPFTQETLKGEYEIPYPEDIQPSTHAFGYVGQLYISKSYPSKKLGFILINRYEINEQNIEKYRFGHAWFTSLFISKGFLRHFTGLFQVRNENRQIDYEDKIKFTSSGGNVLFLAPMLTWRMPKNFNLTGTFDVPVSRNYNGIQLSPRYALGFSLLKQF